MTSICYWSHSEFELYGEHVQSMWKQIITHLYLPSMWNLSNPGSLHSQLLDFDSSEQWYRAELRVRLVQVLMEVSIQSLHVMMGETDMENQTAVLNTMALFRTLEGNMRVGSNTETLSTRRTLWQVPYQSGAQWARRSCTCCAGGNGDGGLEGLEVAWSGDLSNENSKVECGVSDGLSIPFWKKSATWVQTRNEIWDCQLLPNPLQPTNNSGALGSTKSVSVCVCVSIGGDPWFMSLLSRVVSCIFWLVSARHCLEASFIWIHADLSEVSTRNGIPHLNYMGLDVKPWHQTADWWTASPSVSGCQNKHKDSCDLWNKLCMAKLGSRRWLAHRASSKAIDYFLRSNKSKINFKSGRDAFAWQTRQETVDKQRSNSFDQWLKPMQIALRPLLWEVCSDVYTRFKTTYKAAHEGKACVGVCRFELEQWGPSQGSARWNFLREKELLPQ